MTYLTASHLYNYLKCQHRVWRDIYDTQNEKIQETNPFVELLWKKGVQHEENIMKRLGEVTDISEGTLDERLKETINSMKNGSPCGNFTSRSESM